MTVLATINKRFWNGFPELTELERQYIRDYLHKMFPNAEDIEIELSNIGFIHVATKYKQDMSDYENKKDEIYFGTHKVVYHSFTLEYFFKDLTEEELNAQLEDEYEHEINNKV